MKGDCLKVDSYVTVSQGLSNHLMIQSRRTSPINRGATGEVSHKALE